MAKKVAYTTLNASTVDIMNVIRANAPQEYQDQVPVVEQATDIPKVGAIIYGTPAFSNHFLNSLVNRIAYVRVHSATFNNPYKELKKGYINYGESIEEIFVGIAKAYEYSAEKAQERELKRTIPDVKSVFHVLNYSVVYPITIQDNDLYQAFLSIDGVTDLISRIVDQIYTAAEYDEFLLFKYLLIKAASHGKLANIQVVGTANEDPVHASARYFRGISNKFTFMSKNYNEQGVATNTPRDRQIIFMDAQYNADFDVDVLAAAFNMDKADFLGRLKLVDDWTTFDNDRFSILREHSDGLEEVTSAELDVMKNVKAIILDENWFQVYDNLDKFTVKYAASGLYWNYFYHVRKTVSYSPFSNAVVVTDQNVDVPTSITATVTGKDVSEKATVFTLELHTADGATLVPDTATLVTTETMAQNGIACLPYGVVIIPVSAQATTLSLEAELQGTKYKDTTATLSWGTAEGATFTLSKE